MSEELGPRLKSVAEHQMRAICERWDVTLEELIEPGKRRRFWDHNQARAECYRLLVRRQWTKARIARYFKRSELHVLYWTNDDFRESRLKKRARA